MLRFRPNFGAPPGLVREVTLIGVTQQGAAFARALHHGRAADCAAIGQQACLTQVLDPTVASQLTRLEAGERVLAGRDLRATASRRAHDLVRSDQGRARRRARSGLRTLASG